MNPYLLAATVHFVGIIAFMHQPATPSTQSGVFAIIPQDFQSPLPKHTAMIMYHSKDLLGSTGWKGSSLHHDGLKYVQLNHGDLVTFDTGGATNPPAGVPTTLPHNPASSMAAQLDLLPSYGPDDRSHATVVAIPAGTLNVCEDNRRSDTSITLNARGSFTIKVKTKSGTKTLRLKSGAEVSIVNVPFSYADKLADNHQAENHYLEYCIMAGLPPDESHCPEPVYFPSAPACPWPGRDMLVAKANAPQNMPGMGAGADCSNTQWP